MALTLDHGRSLWEWIPPCRQIRHTLVLVLRLLASPPDNRSTIALLPGQESARTAVLVGSLDGLIRFYTNKVHIHDSPGAGLMDWVKSPCTKSASQMLEV